MGIGILIIFLAVAMRLGSKIRDLRLQEQEAIQKEEQLQKQIDAEEERTKQLQEEKKRVNTDEFIEEMARDRLGLIYPGEMLFKEEGK
ncbi:MAG: septum formation initiator family protein [Eubacteriales bacterium]|nr:septum formation initiator family protein [Eubacteriales bacterium]